MENKELNSNTSKDELFDYDFLKEDVVEDVPKDDLVSSQFDRAFNQSSLIVQEYLMSEKLQENIKLICKIEKLNDEKSQIIVENVVVSLLVGLLPINEAKNTLMESFRASGIILESFTAGMLLKNIDIYILSDIRKQILESKIEKNTEIRYLTLKEKREETEKEELRRILLERTGNISGKGETLIQYKEREIPKIVEEIKNKEEEKEEEKEFTRDSLLKRINLHNISDTERIQERLKQIKKEEKKRFQNSEEKEAFVNNEKEEFIKKEEKNLETKEATLAVIENIKEKLSNHEDEKTDLNELRKQREQKEKELQKEKNENIYKKVLEKQDFLENSLNEIEENILDENFDPYRESF